MVEYTLGKKERLNSKTLIERLFLGGSKSFPAFPLRVVYMSVEPVEEDMAAASILIRRFPAVFPINKLPLCFL